MRTIGAAALVTFHLLLGSAAGLGIVLAVWLMGMLPLGEFRAIVIVASSVIFVFVLALVAYRLFLFAFPLNPGEIPQRSRQEFVYHVHLLFDLLVFSPVLASRLVPVPLLRQIYLGLGAKLGRNTYTAGLICDPIFVTVGDNTILGQDSILAPHALEGERLGHEPIRIGSNVTVGARAVVLNGVTIGDGAIVAVGAVVTKGTQIAAGEVWGGIPARLIRPAQLS